jgi:surfeit locus 1 family protein
MPRISLGRRDWVPQLVPTLIAVPLFVLLLALGHWQLNRAAEKQALWDAFARGDAAAIALPETPPARYSRVQVSGHYVPERQFLLDNMVHAGVPGYRVLTPFARDDGPPVLIDRGWVALGPSRSQLPDLSVGDEPRTITGRIDETPRAGTTLKAPDSVDWPRVLNYPPMGVMERALGRPLYPKIILLDPDQRDGFVRDWHAPGFPPARHLGYAATWFALAVTLLVLYLGLSLKPRDAR